MNVKVKNAKVMRDYEYASATGDEYEYAAGPEEEKKKSDKSDKPAETGKVKKTFKSRVKGFGNKVGNAAKNMVKWVGNHKTRKGARKLRKEKDKSGKEVNKDLIPECTAGKINGGTEDGFIRTNPDGTKTEFKTSEVEKGANGKVYAKEDLNRTGKNTIENGEVVKIVPPEAVKELTTEAGEVIPFHKDDIIDKDAPDDAKAGMSTTKKVMIGSAIAVGVGLVIFTIYKLTKNK